MKLNQSLLIIGKVWPEPASSAAGIRIMQLIDFYQSKECHITFASTAKESEFQIDLKALGIITKFIELNSISFDEFVCNLNPDIVLFDRFMTEEQFGWRVTEQCPNAFRILNTEDLHFLRRARQLSIKTTGNLKNIELRTDDTVREIASIYRSDLTLLVSDVEMDILNSEFQVPKSILFHLPVFSKKNLGSIPSFDSREGFMFIGNFYHEPNWDALRFLKESIWPKIRTKLPEAVLNVYGAYPSQKVLDFHNPSQGFLIHGRVDDAMNVTLKSKVSLAPLRFGAGIKGKLLEAMAAGTPSVTTLIGIEGMADAQNWCGIVTDSVDEFVNGAVSLCTDEILWNQAQLKGFEILLSRFEPEIHLSNFESRLTSTQENIKAYRKEHFIQQLVQHQTLMSNRFLSKWIEEKNKS